MRFLLLLLLLSSSHLSLGVRRLVAEFQHNASHNLSSLLIEEDTGRIYLAGTNILYQLEDGVVTDQRGEVVEGVEAWDDGGDPSVCGIRSVSPRPSHC